MLMLIVCIIYSVSFMLFMQMKKENPFYKFCLANASLAMVVIIMQSTLVINEDSILFTLCVVVAMAFSVAIGMDSVLRQYLREKIGRRIVRYIDISVMTILIGGMTAIAFIALHKRFF